MFRLKFFDTLRKNATIKIQRGTIVVGGLLLEILVTRKQS